VAPAADAAAPAPRKRAPEPAKGSADRVEELARLIVTSLEDDKAEDVVTLDMSGRAAFCDRMIIASGLADRQIAAMAAHLEEKLHKAGVQRVLIEGANGSDWVLLDAGDIIVHLFKPDARSLYALERMWGPELNDA
jgi:ribosome silencing factor RsfS/YbeB/iojap